MIEYCKKIKRTFIKKTLWELNTNETLIGLTQFSWGLFHYNRGGQGVSMLLIYLNAALQGRKIISPKGQVSSRETVRAPL